MLRHTLVALSVSCARGVRVNDDVTRYSKVVGLDAVIPESEMQCSIGYDGQDPESYISAKVIEADSKTECWNTAQKESDFQGIMWTSGNLCKVINNLDNINGGDWNSSFPDSQDQVQLCRVKPEKSEDDYVQAHSVGHWALPELECSNGLALTGLKTYVSKWWSMSTEHRMESRDECWRKASYEVRGFKGILWAYGLGFCRTIVDMDVLGEWKSPFEDYQGYAEICRVKPPPTTSPPSTTPEPTPEPTPAPSTLAYTTSAPTTSTTPEPNTTAPNDTAGSEVGKAEMPGQRQGAVQAQNMALRSSLCTVCLGVLIAAILPNLA